MSGHCAPYFVAFSWAQDVLLLVGHSKVAQGDIPNVASVVYNGGEGSDESEVEVLCPDIVVTKSASNSPISAGEDAIFTILVQNAGEGAADEVILTDELPEGAEWTVDTDLCEIADGILTCDLGTLEPGQAFTITISGPTTNESAEDSSCGEIENLASAEASNEADDDTEGTRQERLRALHRTKRRLRGETGPTAWCTASRALRVGSRISERGSYSADRRTSPSIQISRRS